MAVPMAVIGYGVGMILAELVSAVLSQGWQPSLTITTSYFGGDRPWVLGVVAVLYSYLGAPLIEDVLFRLLALRPRGPPPVAPLRNSRRSGPRTPHTAEVVGHIHAWPTQAHAAPSGGGDRRCEW